MEHVHNMVETIHKLTSTPEFQKHVSVFRKHYKRGLLWTLETGCIEFTGLIIAYLLFFSSTPVGTMDVLIIISFFIGTLLYLGSSRLIKKVNTFLLAENFFGQALTAANKYLFMILSFIPGLYFAFMYEVFILRCYLIVHIVTTSYIFYKRIKEFELIPFVGGLGMSFALASINPTIRMFFSIFGSGWFISSVSSLLQNVVGLSIAVAFLLRLPEQYLPSNMMFGLKVVKYLMFMFSWETWFILMVITTWRNIGAGAETILELHVLPEKVVDGDEDKTE